VAAFHLHLKGQVGVWFSSLNDTINQQLDFLKDAFRQQYISYDVFDPSMVAESAIFENLVLQNQNLETFHSNIRKGVTA